MDKTIRYEIVDLTHYVYILKSKDEQTIENDKI
jgi:hypothetical protein